MLLSTCISLYLLLHLVTWSSIFLLSGQDFHSAHDLASFHQKTLSAHLLTSITLLYCCSHWFLPSLTHFPLYMQLPLRLTDLSAVVANNTAEFSQPVQGAQPELFTCSTYESPFPVFQCSLFSTDSIIWICLVSLRWLLISLISAAGKSISFNQCSSQPSVK